MLTNVLYLGRLLPPHTVETGYLANEKGEGVSGPEIDGTITGALFYFQFVFYLVMNILWLIILIVQVVVALIAWLIWYVIRKVVETQCSQEGDFCVCNADKNVPIKGEA